MSKNDNEKNEKLETNDLKQEEKFLVAKDEESEIDIKYRKAIEILKEEYNKNGSANIKKANKESGSLVDDKTILAYSKGKGRKAQKTTKGYLIDVASYVKNFTDPRRNIYGFIIKELGQDKNTTEGLKKYSGTYKIRHKFPVEIQEIDSLRITVAHDADIAGFGFPYAVNGQNLICKGYLFEKRNCLYLLDISADSIFFAKLSRVDQLDRNYLRGFAFFEQTDKSMVCVTPFIIHKDDAKLSPKQNSEIENFFTVSIEDHVNKKQNK